MNLIMCLFSNKLVTLKSIYQKQYLLSSCHIHSSFATLFNFPRLIIYISFSTYYIIVNTQWYYNTMFLSF